MISLICKMKGFVEGSPALLSICPDSGWAGIHTLLVESM